MSTPLLRCDGVSVAYPSRGLRGAPVPVLRDVSLEIAPGETLGLLGESGSGKTTLGRAILGLAPVTAGSITLDDVELTTLSRRGRREIASDLQVVFQDPYTSLNPSMTVSDILTEPLIVAGVDRAEANRRVLELLDQVRLPADAASRLPREFSGGQRQRIAVARALSRSPRLIVCDEPVSALDLSTQARVLEMFIEIQERTGVAYLFITHDIAVARSISHRVAVMRGGEVVEIGDADQVTARPSHPYTQQLMLAAPVPDPVRQAERRKQRLATAATR